MPPELACPIVTLAQLAALLLATATKANQKIGSSGWQEISSLVTAEVPLPAPAPRLLRWRARPWWPGVARPRRLAPPAALTAARAPLSAARRARGSRRAPQPTAATCVCASPPRPRATCTWAARAPRSSTGSSRGSWAESLCCASRTPTRYARATGSADGRSARERQKTLWYIQAQAPLPPLTAATAADSERACACACAPFHAAVETGRSHCLGDLLEERSRAFTADA